MQLFAALDAANKAMRTKTFTMKDAYSFDVDEAGLDKSYQDMFDAYTKIFARCELDNA